MVLTKLCVEPPRHLQRPVRRSRSGGLGAQSRFADQLGVARTIATLSPRETEPIVCSLSSGACASPPGPRPPISIPSRWCRATSPTLSLRREPVRAHSEGGREERGRGREDRGRRKGACMHRARACEGRTAHGQTRGEMIQGRSQGKNKRAGRATASRGGDEHEATASCVRGEHEFEARERAVESACSRSLLVCHVDPSSRRRARSCRVLEFLSDLSASARGVGAAASSRRARCEESFCDCCCRWLLPPATAASPRSVSLLPWAACEGLKW